MGDLDLTTGTGSTHIVQSRAVFSRLDDLNSRLVAHLDVNALRNWNLRQADRARIRVVRGTDNLERWYDRVAHVFGDFAESHIDVHQSRGVTLEPAWLDSNGATANGPVSAISRRRHTATCRFQKHQDQTILSQTIPRSGIQRVAERGGGGKGEIFTWIGPLHSIRVVERPIHGVIGHSETI